MKRVKSLIKLTKLNSESLNEKELSQVVGGHCVCACFYENCGGVSVNENGCSNYWEGLHSEIPWNQAEWGFILN